EGQLGGRVDPVREVQNLVANRLERLVQRGLSHPASSTNRRRAPTASASGTHKPPDHASAIKSIPRPAKRARGVLNSSTPRRTSSGPSPSSARKRARGPSPSREGASSSIGQPGRSAVMHVAPQSSTARGGPSRSPSWVPYSRAAASGERTA